MMLSKFFKPAKTRTILFISLSNIGDVVLTFPVFDALCEAYPDALFSVVVSAKGKALFDGNVRVKKVHILEKHSGIRAKVRWLKDLRKEKFDLVVDMRNSMLPFLTRARRRTRPVFAREAEGHMREKHLRRLQTVLKNIPLPRDKHALRWTREEMDRASALLMGIRDFVVVAPGAADGKKRWTEEGFIGVIRYLSQEFAGSVVILGDRKDGKFAAQILSSLSGGILNLCGMTSLKELSFILSKARLAVVNDSGIMHLASYLDRPAVALFGPTDPGQYGPWGKNARVVRSFSGRMIDIEPGDVISAIAKVLE